MISKNAKINPNIFEEKISTKPSRDGFGDGVVSAGKDDPRIVVLTADLSESTRANKFAETFPNRFFDVGIAEQNLASVASGLAAMGKVPYATSYAVFSPGRNWEQIRTTICYNNQPVKIIGSHAGLLTGPDGGTHQSLEDLAITRVLPNMVVICPCDYEEAKKATIAAATNNKPTYIRLCRDKTAEITTAETPFKIGKAVKVFEPEDGKPEVGIISTGVLLYKVLKVANELEQSGTKVEVLNIHTIKPIDDGAIIDLAKRAGRIVTVEEHQIIGGLGSAVAEVLTQNHPAPIEFVGVKDEYGQSGEGEELLTEYGLDEAGILSAVKKVLGRKSC